MMPKRMVDTVNPEIKKHHSAQDLYLILNGTKDGRQFVKILCKMAISWSLPLCAEGG